MKIINTNDIIPALTDLIITSQINIEENASGLIRRACAAETSPYAKDCLNVILENNTLAAGTNSPPCQDTGIAVFFIDIGCGVRIDGNLNEAVNNAVRAAYIGFRKSVLDPLTRINTGDNTPAVIYYNYTAGDSLTIKYLAKGAGSENMSRIYMLTPARGREGIIESVLDCVKIAGANPCPPIIAGIGIGGTMDKAAVLSKYSLTRSTGAPNPNPAVASLEKEILTRINGLGIGVQGLGGDNTALSVQIETFPTHIGMLPVAVNIQCHSVRHGEITF